MAHSEPKNSALRDIAAKADDFGEIKKSVEDAASISGGLGLSYLFVIFYIAIAAGAVTHEDLLLVRPVKLPFLNVELPLKAFFALAPFVVLIIHAYALMHFIMLGKKASRFHNELRRQFPTARQSPKRAALRRTAITRKFATNCGGCYRAIFSFRQFDRRQPPWDRANDRNAALGKVEPRARHNHTNYRNQ